jgi:uncharacterized membrane protein YeaQ/YmgE (transglycosylase-associated protein family)
MAGYREHITVSGLLGGAYGFAAMFLFHYTYVQAIIAGILTWIAGMLPDLDSESGRPVKELFGLVGALAPLLVLQHVHEMGMSGDRAMMFALLSYAAVKYGGAFLLSKLTVHRGMFHSIPALLIACEIVFLSYYSSDMRVRLLMALAVGVGFLSHLVLDELYSVQWDGTRVRLKSSSGTALKFFGTEAVPNGVTMALLMLLSYMSLVKAGIVREPGKEAAPEVIHVTSDLDDAPPFRVAGETLDNRLR